MYARPRTATSITLGRPQGTYRPRYGSRTVDIVMNPVSSFEETALRLEPLNAALRSLGVERLSLFGSVLRGTADASSDADVLVRFAPGEKSFDRFLQVADLLEARLGRRVELLTTESLSPVLGPKILAEARDVALAT